jgi:hypothetical protein
MTWHRLEHRNVRQQKGCNTHPKHQNVDIHLYLGRRLCAL